MPTKPFWKRSWSLVVDYRNYAVSAGGVLLARRVNLKAFSVLDGLGRICVMPEEELRLMCSCIMEWSRDGLVKPFRSLFSAPRTLDPCYRPAMSRYHLGRNPFQANGVCSMSE